MIYTMVELEERGHGRMSCRGKLPDELVYATTARQNLGCCCILFGFCGTISRPSKVRNRIGSFVHSNQESYVFQVDIRLLIQCGIKHISLHTNGMMLMKKCKTFPSNGSIHSASTSQLERVHWTDYNKQTFQWKYGTS